MYSRVDVAISDSSERLLEGIVTVGRRGLTKPQATAVVGLGLWKMGSNYVLTGWCCNIGLDRETSRRACDCRTSWIYVQAITENIVQFLDWTFHRTSCTYKTTGYSCRQVEVVERGLGYVLTG